MQTATTSAYYNFTSAGLGTLCTAFVMESIQAMIPWLFAMFAIIVCDLVSGVARSLKCSIPVRFSKAVRDTLMKMTTYFFCCVAACILDVATDNGKNIAEWVCLTICFIEGCSILSNILKWHGYTINFNRIVGVVLKKKYDIEMEDSDGIIEKDRKPRRKKKEQDSYE